MTQSKFAYYYGLWNTKKFINLSKNVSSYYWSRLTRQYHVWGKPYAFFIEPTSVCNLACTECPVGLKILSRPQGIMPFDKYRKIVDDIAPHAWYFLLYFQGEPFMNRDIIRMIDYAYERQIFTIISTNGTRLASRDFAKEVVQSQLSELVISLDGATEETYRIYRQNGVFPRVIKGVQNVIKWREKLKKKLPKITIQFLVMRHNEHEIDKVKQLGKEIGADKVILKTAQIYDFENAEDILPQNPKYRRYEKIDGTYRLKGSYTGYCRKLWIGSVITESGIVSPCCFDKDAEYPMGSINGNGFQDVWDGSKYDRFRKSVIKNRKNIPMCNNCSEGLRTFF